MRGQGDGLNSRAGVLTMFLGNPLEIFCKLLDIYPLYPETVLNGVDRKEIQ